MSTNYRDTHAKVMFTTAETLHAAKALHRESMFASSVWMLGLLLPLVIALLTGLHIDAASLAVGTLAGIATMLGSGIVTSTRQFTSLRERAVVNPQRFEGEVELDEEGFTLNSTTATIRFPWSDVTRIQTTSAAVVLHINDRRYVTLPQSQLDRPTRQFVHDMVRFHQTQLRR